MLTERPLLDQMQVTFSFNLILLFLPKFWGIFPLIVSIYDSIITMNDNLLDDTNIMFIFEVLFHFFCDTYKNNWQQINNSLVICVEKRYRMTGKPKKY